MHEQHHTEFLGLGPERIELSIGKLLPFDAAPNRGASHAELLDRVIELIGRQIRVLQRDRRHSDKAVPMRRTVLRDFLILERDQLASQRRVC